MPDTPDRTGYVIVGIGGVVALAAVIGLATGIRSQDRRDEAAGRAYCAAALAAATTAPDTLAVLRDRTARWRCEYFMSAPEVP